MKNFSVFKETPNTLVPFTIRMDGDRLIFMVQLEKEQDSEKEACAFMEELHEYLTEWNIEHHMLTRNTLEVNVDLIDTVIIPLNH